MTNATVIVPAYNAAATLTGCLDSLVSQQTFTDLHLTILVVDDGSTDATVAIATRYHRQGVQLIQTRHRGAAAARNAGVQAAVRSSIILFTDADCTAAPDWAGQLVTALEQAELKVAAVKGVYRTRQRSAVARFAQAEYAERYARFAEGRTKPGFADTYCAAFRREILLEHPFDESLPGAVVEDAELGWRLRQADYAFEFAPQAVVYHQHPARLSHYFQRKFRIGFWRVAIYRRYPGQLSSDGHTSHTTKLQMLLLLGTLGGLGLAGSGRGLGLSARLKRQLLLTSVVNWGLLQLSFGPFLRRVDRSFIPASWFMLNLRTVALTSGALTGLAQLALEKAKIRLNRRTLSLPLLPKLPFAQEGWVELASARN